MQCGHTAQAKAWAICPFARQVGDYAIIKRCDCQFTLRYFMTASLYSQLGLLSMRAVSARLLVETI